MAPDLLKNGRVKSFATDKERRCGCFGYHFWQFGVKKLKEAALQDDYFIQRKLYPNVDFYSGILYRAMGIPTNMFTVMFALGRLPGWLAHWQEMRQDPDRRIGRPRQLYVGETQRRFTALTDR